MQARIELQIAVAGIAEATAARVRQAVAATLADAQINDRVALTVVLTDDATVQALNATYRDEDKVTDVLSFPADEPAPFAGAARYLGDVVIAWPQTVRQAQHAGHAPEAELLLLAVHGTLHLLGHDHAEPDEKARMWAAQALILRAIGAPLVAPATDG